VDKQQVIDDEFELLLPHAAATAKMPVHDNAIDKLNAKPRRFIGNAPFNQCKPTTLQRYGERSSESTTVRCPFTPVLSAKSLRTTHLVVTLRR
jgi:hypothetical protein